MPVSPTVVVRRVSLVTAALLSLGGCPRGKTEGPAGSGTPAAGSASPAPSVPGLTLYYSADLHGHFFPAFEGQASRGGLARWATLVDEARLGASDLVMVDAGDAVAAVTDDSDLASAAALDARARMVFMAYRRMGMDVVVPGERELAMGPDALRALLAETKLTMVAANVEERAPAPGKPLFTRDHLIEESGHRTLGILGVVELPADDIAPLLRAGLVIGDAAEAARASAASLRQRGANLLVAIVHAPGGLVRARQILAGAGLAAGPSAVDVVVIGHRESSSAATERRVSAHEPAHAAEQPLFVQAGLDGATLGRVDISWPPLVGSVPDSPRLRNATLNATSAVAEQPGVALIGWIRTIPIVDNGRLANEPVPAGSAPGEHEDVENWSYGSTEGCGLCHRRELDQWKTTEHAHALETLKTQGRDRAPECLGCHLTGFLAPGGTHNLKTALTFFANVGCESCHGPSVTHIRSPSSHKGTSRRVPALVCLGCHTPDQSRGDFDYVAAVKEILGPGHGGP
jgi:hypothetical protein